MCDCHDLSDIVSLDRGDLLYRRIHHRHKDDVRASLQTSHWKAGLSCDWALLANLEEVVKVRPGDALSISVGDCEDLRLGVHYCPIIDPADAHYPNYAHCLLVLPSDITTKSQIDDLRSKFLSKINRHEVPLAPPAGPIGSQSDAELHSHGRTEDSPVVQPTARWLSRIWRWLASLFK